MAAGSLELVRSIYAAWERGDHRSAEWAHAQAEFVVVGLPEPSSRMGLAAAAPAVEGFLSFWDNYRVEAEEYRELDDERVLVLGRVSGRGKSSGVEVAQRRASLFHVRDGKVTKLVTYWDPSVALAELGLAGRETRS
jgi:ketosteroid isomerase-like protein